ncbi:DNA mismatch repair protein PMS1, putative [Plasmodium ovale]|uniref:DNA mismatch repair protein PMS1, putative n=1 Tax=Plasmodium ovale TaxID=36330 RepID=A0A1C3KMT4_PLAOA|nr:DNA mismatch repair protein PMS1, putative [Plasmodium ovale]
MKIKNIGEESIHNICSSQVVFTLSSVVKELVENAIDANASEIKIKLVENGIKLIEVNDNGIGIKKINFENICTRHATSKITEFTDITNTLSTLGFRGEALNSLCMLSELSISTNSGECGEDSGKDSGEDSGKGSGKDSGENSGGNSCKDSCKDNDHGNGYGYGHGYGHGCGYLLKFDKLGKLYYEQPIARLRGTTISCENIFNNIPIRKKNFIKNIKSQISDLLILIQQYAIIYFKIKFVIYNIITYKGHTKNINLFLSNGNNNCIKNNLYNIFGKKNIGNLIELNIDNNEWKVRGYISDNNSGRKNKDLQFYYINNRPIHILKNVNKIINNIYKEFNSKLYPIIIYNIFSDCKCIDVNVTPDKREIFFTFEHEMCEILKNTLVKLLTPKTCNLIDTHINDYFFKNNNLSNPPYNSNTNVLPVLNSLNNSDYSHDINYKGHLNNSFHVHDMDNNFNHNQLTGFTPHTFNEDVVTDRTGTHSIDDTESQTKKINTNYSTFINSKEIAKNVTKEEYKNGNYKHTNVHIIQNDLPNFVKKEKDHYGKHNNEHSSEHTHQYSSYHTVIENKKKENYYAEHSAHSYEHADEDITNNQKTFSEVHPLNKHRLHDAVQFNPSSSAHVLRGGAEKEQALELGSGQKETIYEYKLGGSEKEAIYEYKLGGSEKEAIYEYKLEGSEKEAIYEYKLDESNTKGTHEERLKGNHGEKDLKDQVENGETSQNENFRMETEVVPFGDCLSGNHPTDNRLADNRPADNRPADNRPSDNRPSDEFSFAELKDNIRSSCIKSIPIDINMYINREKINSSFDYDQIHVINLTNSEKIKNIIFHKMKEEKKLNDYLCLTDERQEDEYKDLFNSSLNLKESSKSGSATGSAVDSEDISFSNIDETRKDLYFKSNLFDKLKICGQFNKGFVISKIDLLYFKNGTNADHGSGSGDDRCTDQRSNYALFVIDQHAADEKSNFEKYNKVFTMKSQKLISKIDLELSPAQIHIIEKNLEIFLQNGFEVEIVEEPINKRRRVSCETTAIDANIGEDTLMQVKVYLLSLPVFNGKILEVVDFMSLLHHLTEHPITYDKKNFEMFIKNKDQPNKTTDTWFNYNFPRPQRVWRILASKACRNAVMVGTSLNIAEMIRIKKKLSVLKNPWNCPHGRPTIKYIINDIDIKSCFKNYYSKLYDEITNLTLTKNYEAYKYLFHNHIFFLIMSTKPLLGPILRFH